MTTRRAALALVAVLAVCTACSDQRGSTAAPPLVVCGTTLSHTAAGPVLYDASSRPITINEVSVSGEIYLKLSPDCHTGVHLAIQPMTAATIVTEVPASDGQPAAVVIKPATSQFNIQIDRADSSRDVIKVNLTDPPSGTTATAGH